MRSALFKSILIVCSVTFFSCKNKDRENFGDYTLSSSNVNQETWIKSTFPKLFIQSETIDSSIISIRVSRKVVMRGFNKPGDTTFGAFGKLLQVFSGFNTPHNPKGRKEYRFFDGDNLGLVSSPISESEYFNQGQYTSKSNNLHFQFENIATEITSDTLNKTFYVIFSDGETTIRKEQNDNTNELIILKEGVKKILQHNPNIQIGILSLIADFNGDYTYDINKSENIKCKRYLYAFCFFDKIFLPEFNRFSQLNKNLGGNNFLFNPQLSLKDYETSYLIKEIQGQPNISENKYFSAFRVEMPLQDLEIKLQNTNKLNFITFPAKFTREVYQYTQIDTMLFGKPVLISNSICAFNEIQAFVVPNIVNSCLIKSDLIVDYNMPVDSILVDDFRGQDIMDNRKAEMDLIKTKGPGSILKTEGLKDMCDMILQALQESSKFITASNFIQLGKD